MGTLYAIKFGSNTCSESIQTEIDSLLYAFEDELSTYRDHSTISQFNKSEKGIAIDTNSHFYNSFKGAIKLNSLTKGYFDPTISPLVNYYGFGYDRQSKKQMIEMDTIEQLLDLVGMQKLRVKKEKSKAFIFKSDPDQKLSLNASAKGLGVDVVSKFLIHKGINDFMVEIGGEVFAKGINQDGNSWTVGISRPEPGASPTDILVPIRVENVGLASSGNYRNYYKNDSTTFVHIIDTKTGLSRPTDILSATVIADDCETADAFATSLMAMGLEKSIALTNELEQIKTCLIYYNEKGDSLAYVYSNGFEQNIVE